MKVLSGKAWTNFSLLITSIAKRGLLLDKYFCKFIDMDLYWFSIIGFTTSYLFLIILGLSLLTISITCIIAFFCFKHREMSRRNSAVNWFAWSIINWVLIMIAENNLKIDHIVKIGLTMEEEQIYNNASTEDIHCVVATIQLEFI